MSSSINLYEVEDLVDHKEEDGISSSPVLLPIAIYTNPISKSYTILEYHPSYKSYCIISVGLDLE